MEKERCQNYNGIFFWLRKEKHGKISGLPQRELADLSGVALRQIQLFEQKKRNINHTRAIDVLKIGKVLGCKSEDLLEI